MPTIDPLWAGLQCINKLRVGWERGSVQPIEAAPSPHHTSLTKDLCVYCCPAPHAALGIETCSALNVPLSSRTSSSKESSRQTQMRPKCPEYSHLRQTHSLLRGVGESGLSQCLQRDPCNVQVFGKTRKACAYAEDYLCSRLMG